MKKALLLIISLHLSLLTFGQIPKGFKWIPWKNVTAAQKAELKKISYMQGMTVYDHVVETLEYPCTVDLAVLDMDGDGKMEYAIQSVGRDCCGSRGCSLDVYSDRGRKQIHLADYLEDVKPAKNGVISSRGLLIRFTKYPGAGQ